MRRCSLQILLTIAVVLLSKGLSYPQIDDKSAAKVDHLLQKWNVPDGPGMAIAIIKDNETVYTNCMGLATLEYGIPITPSTVFHIASLSKQFTAFAIANLEQEKRLSLDDDISEYLPGLPDLGTVIKIRHLLNHTSGLYEQSTMLKLSGVEVVDWVSNEHVLKLVKREKKLNFNPGDEIDYCNTGYTLLAEIVERVTGQPLNEYANEIIFEPLGMNHSHFHDDLQMIEKDKAFSYIQDETGNYLKGILNFSTVGATGLRTTIDDMIKWLKNFSRPKVGGDFIDRMFTSGVLNNGELTTYGYGLGITEYRGLKYVLHSGHDAGYKSYLGYFPDQKFGIVILANLGSVDGMELGKQIADIYLEDYFSPSPTDSLNSVSDEQEEVTEKPFELKWKQLWEFSGRFYCHELDTSYLIIVRDGQLVATHIRNEDVILIPIEKDKFEGGQWWFRDIRYLRNGNDEITGFLMNARGVRDLLFERM